METEYDGRKNDKKKFHESCLCQNVVVVVSLREDDPILFPLDVNARREGFGWLKLSQSNLLLFVRLYLADFLSLTRILLSFR